MFYKSTVLVDEKFADDPKEQINKAVLDLLKKINSLPDLLIPIGFEYDQKPGMKTPQELWPWAEWQDISSDYAGCFFRAEGGKALPFGTGKQDNAMSYHWHNLKLAGSSAGGALVRAVQTSTGSTDLTPIDDVQDAISDGVNPAPNLATENRPDNYTIRIWKRTA